MSQSEDNSSKGGRPQGTGQAQVNARKALKNVIELGKRINEDSLDAYQTLVDLMKDSDASYSVRRGIAKDIIEWQMEFAAEAPQVLGKPSNRHAEKEQEVASVAKKVVSFSTKAQ